MSNTKNTILKWMLGVCMLFAGVPSVWADLKPSNSSQETCTADVFVKIPTGWKSAYIVLGGQSAKMSPSLEYPGWYTVSTSAITNGGESFAVNELGTNDCSNGNKCMTKAGVEKENDRLDLNGFTCKDIGDNGQIWIMENPIPVKAGQTHVASSIPQMHTLYVMIPDNQDWMSAVVMFSEDGTYAGKKEFYMDPDRCGWAYTVWFDQDPPSNFLIFRDDDATLTEAIGQEGIDEVHTPIDLSVYFLLYGSDTLYYIPDEGAREEDSDDLGFSITEPQVEGTCSYNMAAVIYDTDASLHGAFTCNPDWKQGQTATEAAQNACPSSAPYQVAGAAGVIPCIGITQKMVTDILDKTTKKPTLTDIGRACFGAQADQAFAAMFNSTPNVNETYCVDLPFSRSSDNKWEFDSDTYKSPGAPVAGGFYPAETTPDATKFLSAPLAAAENKRKAEGPVFFCADYNNNTSRSPEGLRTIHPTEGVPYSDLICNGPGWDGGVDCNGIFKGGSEFAADGALTALGRQVQTKLGVTWEQDGWAWSCPNMGPIGWTYYKQDTETPVGELVKKNQVPANGQPRWMSGASDSQVLTTAGRNQHFCFESHAHFTYKPGLRFSFRGDDDIWVYIDNKLAVDLGGTHLAAPGYVDLDKFVGASGGFTTGKSYDIDIFFCDRRTTMSNVRIKTNMYIKQSSGMEGQAVTNKQTGDVTLSLCYTETGDGSCASVGKEEDVIYKCGPEIVPYLEANGKKMHISVETARGDVVPGLEDLPPGGVYAGCIDLTDPSNPIVNKTKCTKPLEGGKYKLKIGVINTATGASIGSPFIYNFKIAGDLDVVTRNAVYKDTSDNLLGNITFVGTAMAGTRIPVYVADVYDPCQAATGACTEPLTVYSAAGKTYSLTYTPADVTFYTTKEGNEAITSWPRTVPDGGIDTIWADLPIGLLQTAQQLVTVNVTKRPSTANLKFFAPQIVFVADDTSFVPLDPQGDATTYERWVGSVYDFYLVALAPTSDTTFAPCGKDCNFDLNLSGEGTSPGVELLSSTGMVDGRATISIRSTKEYRNAGANAGPTDYGNAAVFKVIGPLPNLVNATYYPIYFKEPPVPYPVLTDLFDVQGTTTISQYNIPSPYYDPAQEYLDGIADSVAVYYNRNFNRDSLPDSLFFLWESDKDSVRVDFAEIKAAAKCGAEAGLADTLCSNILQFSGLKLSKKPKTSGTGAIHSWAKFEDRGQKVVNHFDGELTDRMAPVPISANIRAQKEGSDYDILTITMSEKIELVDLTNVNNPFTAYLNSVTASGATDADKYTHPTAYRAPTVANNKVSIVYDHANDARVPHVGDYIRIRADLPTWVDSTNINVPGSDTLRAAADADVHWNEPTDYMGSDKGGVKRLPSPWVPVTGETPILLKAIKYVELSDNDIVAENTPVVQVKTFPTNKDFDDLKKDSIKNQLGFMVYADLFAKVNSKTEYSEYFSADSIQLYPERVHDIYFFYEVEYYTNLGNFVAQQTAKIYCDDKEYFGGLTCLDEGRNFWLGWNMLSDKKRLVGTGAYIAKINTYVKLGKFGKMSKQDDTQTWGVRRGKGVIR